MFTLPKGGAMFTASVAGQKFSFKGSKVAPNRETLDRVRSGSQRSSAHAAREPSDLGLITMAVTSHVL